MYGQVREAIAFPGLMVALIVSHLRGDGVQRSSGILRGQLGVGSPWGWRLLLYSSSLLSLAAALVHAWLMPEHFQEWWGYGTFFLFLALGQALYSVALLRRTSLPLIRLGIAVTLGIMGLYLVTRTLGIPFFGPHAGHAEEVGTFDVVSKGLEAGLVFTLLALLWESNTKQARRQTLMFLGILLALPLAALILARLIGSLPTTTAPTPNNPDLAEQLTRFGTRPEGSFPSVDVLLVTREFVASTGNHQLLETVTEPSLLFYLYEESHEDLPSLPPEPLLGLVGAGVDRTPQAPAEVRVLTDSPHHRAVLVRYMLSGPLVHLEHGMGERLELVFPALQGKAGVGNVLSWDLPIRYGQSSLVGSPVLRSSSDGIATFPGVQGSSLSIAMVLGLFGGFLASMWPCLFQLTAYFIPSIAGVSFGQAQSGNATPALRLQVLKSALFFVLGIVIVYTAAGAVIGLAAQSLSGTALFQAWQRPLSILAGLVLIGMAIRVMAQARVPLVCKMPIISHLGGRGSTGPVGTMILGLAFATGCMTCFGSAVALGLLTYVISSASMLTGAFLLFLFSLGISIPLVAAAVAMAQVLPLLGRLERLAPSMALVSGGIMIAFAGLLISGQYHALSTVIARAALGG